MPSLLARALPWLAAVGLLVVALLPILLFVDVKPIFADRLMRPPADACPRLDIGPRQCEGVVTRAMKLAAVDPATVMDIDLGRPDGPRAEIGGLLIATAYLHLADGRSIGQEVWCIGVGGQNQAWCTEDPDLELWMGANHDVPVGATPIVLDSLAVAAARPLRISRPAVGNVYKHGLILGVEPVVAYLVFHVVDAPDGAVLQVRDVVVR